MTRRNKLTIYRRHADSCPVPASANPKDLQNCECPLWVHGKINGVSRRESLDTRSLTMATLKRENILDPPPDPSGGPRVIHTNPNITLEDAKNDFLKSKKTKSTSTQSRYKLTAEWFIKFVASYGVILLRQVDRTHVESFLEQRESGPTGWKGSTPASYLRWLRVFFNHCVRERHWLAHSPASSRDLNRSRGTSSRKPFTPAEVTRILLAIDKLPEALRARARALILLLLYTGMRISDATFVERSYLQKINMLKYYVIKTRRLIELAPTLQHPVLEALEALPDSRVYFFQPDADDDYWEARQALRDEQEFGKVMPGYLSRIDEMRNLVKKVIELAGLTGSCHKFRHTFAVNMLMGGADIYMLSKMLGHTKVEITEQYLKLVPDYEERMSQMTRVLSYALPPRKVA